MTLDDGKHLSLGRIVGTNRVLAISPKQRRTHMHVIGATGSGKSKFLEHLIRQDILERRGLCLIDPHGELANDLLSWVSRLPAPPKHFHYIAPHRDDWTLCYNPLQRNSPDEWFLVNALKIAVAKCWGADNTQDTPRLDEWLKTAFYTGIYLGLTLPEIGMLLEPSIERNIQRRAVLNRLPKSQTRIRTAWEHLCGIAEKKPTEFEAIVGSTTRRLSSFSDNPRLNRLFGVPDISLNLRSSMDDGAVLLVDLSTKGRLHSEDAHLFGTLLLTDFYIQMFNREQPEKPFTLYVDEFQNYATKDLARMLDEARKFGLQLVLAHQRPGQLQNADSADGRDLYSAVMTNARTKVVFGGITSQELEPIARMLSIGMLDPKKIKEEIRTRSVVDYCREYWQSHSTGRSTSHSSGTGHSTSHTTMTGSGTAGGTATLYDGSSGPGPLHTTESSSWSRQFSASDGYSDTSIEMDVESESESTTIFPVLVPVLGQQLSAIYYETLDEQLYQFLAVLTEQQERQAMVRVVGQKEAIPIQVPYVRPPRARSDDIEHQLTLTYQSSKCYLPVSEADALVLARQKQFLALGGPVVTHKPESESYGKIEIPFPMPSSGLSITPLKVGTVELQDRDFALLQDVFDNRFISIRHAAALHWSGASAGAVAAKRRLAQLASEDLLQSQSVNATGCKLIYRITKKAVDLLVEYDRIPATIRDNWDGKIRKRHTDAVGDGHLPHELKLYDLKVLLQPAINNHPNLRVVEFGIYPLPYVFEVIYKGRRSPQQPDGFLHIHEHTSPSQPPKSHYFYLEFDHRRSEDRDIVLQKVEKYRAYLERGFGPFIGKPDAPKSERSFRVLIVVDTADSNKRRDNICSKLAGAGIGTIAYVATLADLAGEPLGAVWLTPKDYQASQASATQAIPFRPLIENLSTGTGYSAAQSPVLQ